MRNGNNIPHHLNHAPEFSLSVSPRNENYKNQAQYDYKTFQIVNGNQLEIKSIPYQNPQKFNNMMPGKKLKAVRVNSDKVPSAQNTMHDWRQIVSKNQQSQIKQQQNTTSCVAQTSNYNIVSLAQAIQGSTQYVETKSQEVFKFTTNNFNKKKRSNTNVITDIITNDRQLQNQSSPEGIIVNNQEQNRFNKRKQSEHSSVCVIYKHENEKDLTQSFIQKDLRAYSTQKSEIIPTNQNAITENNSRQNSPSLSTLIIQNQQRQFNNMKNTYDLKNLESQDQNKIKITYIVNQKLENKQNDNNQAFVQQNNNQKNDQVNQNLTNLKDQQSQLKINNYQLLTSVKIPQTFILNPFYIQQIQNQQQQQESQNEESHIFQSNYRNSLYECIFNRQSPYKIGGFKKQDEDISRLQTAEVAQQEDTLDIKNINPSDNNKNNQEQVETQTAKKRSSSTQKSPQNGQSYQTNYQFQNLISIQNQKFLPIQKQSGSQFLYQRMILRSAQNSIQQKDMHQSQEKNQKVENNTPTVNGFQRTGAIDNFKQLVDFNKERQNQEANFYLTQKKVFKKPTEGQIISGNKFNQAKAVEQNCENNKLQGVQQSQNKIKLDPIQRQERAKSAQDTQFKAFNEETYIVNLDDQKQQILHIRKLRRKNGDSNPITQQYQNKEDYYNTPIQSEQVKKKNSIGQIDTEMPKAINYKQMNVFLTGQPNQNSQQTEKAGGGEDKKDMNKTQVKYKNKQQLHRVKDVDYSSKIQKTENQQIDQNDTTTQVSISVKKGQNNNSNKLIKLQQYYDLKYESKYGKFWDNNKRKVSSDSYQNKLKYNHKLNMSMQQDQSLNYQTTQYQFSNIQSQCLQPTQGKQDQQGVDDSKKSVLKILHEKQKREQENTNTFTNPDPWDQESLSDSSFTIENTKK